MAHRDIDLTDALMLTEEKVGSSLGLPGTGKDFLSRTPLEQALRLAVAVRDPVRLLASAHHRLRSPTEWSHLSQLCVP